MEHILIILMVSVHSLIVMSIVVILLIVISIVTSTLIVMLIVDLFLIMISMETSIYYYDAKILVLLKLLGLLANYNCDGRQNRIF